MHLAIDRVCIYIICIEFQRVGVHIQRVGLAREVLQQHAVSGIAIACLLIVEQPIAPQFVLIERIDIYHIAETLVYSSVIVVEKTVADNGFLLIDYGRTSVQLRLVGLGVEVCILGLNYASVRRYARRTGHMGHRLAGIIEQRVGQDDLFVAEHLHVVEERCLPCRSVILTPVGHELIFSVNQLAAFEEVSVAIKAVVIKTVGIKSASTMFHHHIATRQHHLLHAVVLGVVARQRERITLFEPHMSESLHGIIFLEKVRAVAPEICSVVSEMHLALGYLRHRIQSVGIILQFVGVHQIHPVVLSRLLRCWQSERRSDKA